VKVSELQPGMLVEDYGLVLSVSQTDYHFVVEFADPDMRLACARLSAFSDDEDLDLGPAPGTAEYDGQVAEIHTAFVLHQRRVGDICVAVEKFLPKPYPS